jgi:hypothetical protein
MLWSKSLDGMVPRVLGVARVHSWMIRDIHRWTHLYTLLSIQLYKIVEEETYKISRHECTRTPSIN